MSNTKLLILALVLVFAALASGAEDPELEECRTRCAKKKQYGQEQVQECQEKCDRDYKEKRREQETEEEKGKHGGDVDPEDPFKRLMECEGKCVQKQDERERTKCHDKCYEKFRKEIEPQEKQEGPGGGVLYLNPGEKDPSERFRKCEGECQQKQDEREQRDCHQRCREEFEREKREEEQQHGGHGENPRETEEMKEGEPFVFQFQHYSTKVKTEHGRIRILQRFNERWEILRGIENFRVAILEADPRTFIVPNHWDADRIVFVHQGRATVSVIRQGKRESFNIRQGDVLRIRAGTTVYLVNPDKNERLVTVMLVLPVFTPGHFETFFGPGGENPESFFRAFSPELLEAAFNTGRDKFERILKQKEGMIIEASEEQIKGMSHHEEGGIWPFGGEGKGPYNLFKDGPSRSNQYGKEYAVGPRECSDLREHNLGVSFANMTRGSMTAPMFNSRATKIAIVLEGEAYLEIACPHMSESGKGKDGKSEEEKQGGGSSSQRETTPSYQKVKANLQVGTVFVIPAGHPFIIVSQDKNLEVVCFNVNDQDNERPQLAGKNNIFNQFESEAKKLSFGVSEKEVDEVFKSQKDEFFLKGPSQKQEGEGRADA